MQKRPNQGFRLARQGRGFWVEAPDRRIHPEGEPYYWLGGKWTSFDEPLDSDITYLEGGYVAAVPIHIGELTDIEAFRKTQGTCRGLFSVPFLGGRIGFSCT